MESRTVARALVAIFSMLLLIGKAKSATAGTPCWDKVCDFTLTLTLGHTMTRTLDNGETENLELTPTSCLKPGESGGSSTACLKTGFNEASSSVVTGDGRRRQIILVNGQYPGPSIEVLEGTEVIIRVRNRMTNVPATLHWHGMFQKGTPWFDGPAWISQCPILPAHDFTYKFIASPAGTKFYHPHLANLRSEGGFGFFIVHTKIPEMPELPLFLNDLNEDGGIGERVSNIRINSIAEIPNPVSSLINGRGTHPEVPGGAPLANYQVVAGERYKFRVVNAAADLAYAISIDSHTLTVVAWDGVDIDPVVADIVNVFPGERIDFIIEAGSDAEAYLVRAAALPQEDMNPLDVEAVIYTGTNTAVDVRTTTIPTECTAIAKCKVFNCYRHFGSDENKMCIELKQIKTASSDAVSRYLGTPDTNLFYNVGTSTGDGLNGYRFVEPQSPFYRREPQNLVRCSDKLACSSVKDACWCTHGQQLPRDKLIEVVIANLELDPEAHDGSSGHPMHLHGHQFVVVGHGFATWDAVTGKFVEDNKSIVCPNDLCRTQPAFFNTSYPIDARITDRPPMKDTVIVPVGGFVIIRFVTDNPGFWLLHCHLLRDQIDGMQMYFEVAPEVLRHPIPQTPPCSPNYMMVSGSDGEVNSSMPSNQSEKLLTPIELFGVVIGSAGAGIMIAILFVLISKMYGSNKYRSDKVGPHVATG